MRIVVTAGNTLVPIDRVRAITNIFTGRTGAAIARAAHQRGHSTVLLTSHPETANDLRAVVPYQTFDDLAALLKRHIGPDSPDAVVHCAAVSDYRVASVHRSHQGTIDPEPLNTVGKLKSNDDELWLRLTKTPKLIDSIRTELGFKGVLVKFKLEVGVTPTQLLDIAESSRRQSKADLMVANIYDGSVADAYLGPIDGRYIRQSREQLPDALLNAIETCAGEAHG